MATIPKPSDSYLHQLDALDRLGAARAVIDAVLAGRWAADPETVDQAAALLGQAAQRLRWAAGCETRARAA